MYQVVRISHITKEGHARPNVKQAMLTIFWEHVTQVALWHRSNSLPILWITIACKHAPQVTLGTMGQDFVWLMQTDVQQENFLTRSQGTVWENVLLGTGEINITFHALLNAFLESMATKVPQKEHATYLLTFLNLNSTQIHSPKHSFQYAIQHRNFTSLTATESFVWKHAKLIWVLNIMEILNPANARVPVQTPLSTQLTDRKTNACWSVPWGLSGLTTQGIRFASQSVPRGSPIQQHESVSLNVLSMRTLTDFTTQPHRKGSASTYAPQVITLIPQRENAGQGATRHCMLTTQPIDASTTVSTHLLTTTVAGAWTNAGQTCILAQIILPTSVFSSVPHPQTTTTRTMSAYFTAKLLDTLLILQRGSASVGVQMSRVPRRTILTVTNLQEDVSKNALKSTGGIIRRICVGKGVLWGHLLTMTRGCVWLNAQEISRSMLIRSCTCVRTLVRVDISAVRSINSVSKLVIMEQLRQQNTGVTLWLLCASMYALLQHTLTGKTSHEHAFPPASLTQNTVSQTITHVSAGTNARIQLRPKPTQTLRLLLACRSARKVTLPKTLPTNVFKCVSQGMLTITVDTAWLNALMTRKVMGM